MCGFLSARAHETRLAIMIWYFDNVAHTKSEKEDEHANRSISKINNKLTIRIHTTTHTHITSNFFHLLFPIFRFVPAKSL